jgi:hypothetical protein
VSSLRPSKAQERHGVAGKQPAQRGQQAPVALALGQIERQVGNDGKQRLQQHLRSQFDLDMSHSDSRRIDYVALQVIEI